jgi:prophage regulatory protein
MMSINKVIIVGNLGRDSLDMYSSAIHHFHRVERKPKNTGPVLSISDDMPNSGGGAGVTAGVEVAASDDDDDGGDADSDPDRRKELRTSKHFSGADRRKSKLNKRRDGAVNNPTNTPDAEKRNAAATVGASPPLQDPDIALWRLPTVLAHVPVSRSGWWAGVKAGRYPAPVRLSTRCVAWRAADIRSLVQSF